MPRGKYYGYWTIDRLEERKLKRPTTVLSPIAKTRAYAVYRCPWGCGREFEVPAERATQLRSVIARDHAAVCVPYVGIRPPKPSRSSRVTYASLDSIGPIDEVRNGGAGQSPVGVDNAGTASTRSEDAPCLVLKRGEGDENICRTWQWWRGKWCLIHTNQN